MPMVFLATLAIELAKCQHDKAGRLSEGTIPKILQQDVQAPAVQHESASSELSVIDVV